MNDPVIVSDKGLVSVLVLLGLSVAFDTTDQVIRLQRPEHLIGIKGIKLSF